MAGQVQFYVNRVHSIGGVTTWSFQAASYMARRYRTRVVTVNTGVSTADELFPGKVMEVWRNPSDAIRGSGTESHELQPKRAEKPTKPVKPAKKPRKVRKATKPTKPTKPTKKPTLPPPEGNGCENSNDRVNGRDSVPMTQRLHRSAEAAIEEADLFIPNYLDFAYELAARSRAQGIASRCIGICHCDHDNYYQLLTHYAPIIHSFIAVSPRCMNRLAECLPARVDDMHLVPYGVAPGGTRSIRRRAGPIRLLYAGRLAKQQKRIFDLVSIAGELDARRIDYQLDIVGVGPDREPLVAALCDNPRVQFQPGVSHTEIANVYQDHDVFLLPSETEGTSIALLESMAHGLVPVATRVSGSEDVIVPGVNGFLCGIGEIGCMVDSIAALAGNLSKQEQLARNAQQTVAEHYRIDTQLEAFEHCVQETLQKPLMTVEAAQSVLRRGSLRAG